ncbi:MAG: hypothetical protein RJB66_742 [Pseudomonadota bacterium]|jgi:hypothetical protein
MKIYGSFIFLLMLVPLFSQARFQLPHQLTSEDRKSALSVLGPATNSRLLSSGYPLGGWQGFEIGLSRHYVPASYLNSLGDQSNQRRDFEYPILTFGKGLYYDFDLILSFVPMFQSESISHTSAQVRRQFWQSPKNIFRVVGLAHAETTNLANQLGIQGYGFNIIGTTTIDKISLFIGVGASSWQGTYIGGARGVTDSGDTEINRVLMAHHLIGFEWPIDNYFVAAEVDRYDSPYYSMKLGYRL